jgi:hypothetical protein
LSYVSSKRRKEFLVLTCGQSASLSKGKTEDEMGLSDESEDEETVSLTTSAYSIQGFPMGIMNVFKIMPFITIHAIYTSLPIHKLDMAPL